MARKDTRLFRLDGVDQFIKKLAKVRAGRELRGEIRKVLRMAARPVLATARQIAPEDSGDLRRSLVIRAAKRTRRGIGVVVRPGTRAEIGISADAKGYYPTHIEFGTENITAVPYLRDAIKLERVDSFEIIFTGVGKAIERIAGPIA